MDHNCLELGDDLPEFGPGLALVEIWLAVNDRPVVGFNGSGHVGSLVWVGGIAKASFIVNVLLLEGSVAAERLRGIHGLRGRRGRRQAAAPRLSKAARCDATKSCTVMGGTPVTSAMILSAPEKMPF